MRRYTGSNCDQAYREAAADLRLNGKIQASRTQDTKELLHTTFSVNNPKDRVVFSRPINPAFAVAEVLWIIAGRRDEQYLDYWNPRMRKWMDEEGNLRGYGYRLREHFGIDQLIQASETLRTRENSRQVVLQIWDARHDLPDPHPRSKDVPCNITSHLLLRDGMLEWLQVLRSNDLIWGTPYNFIQFTSLQEVLAGWIGADVGSYQHVSSSLHVYERHWDHLQDIPDERQSPKAKPASIQIPLGEWKEIEDEISKLPERLAESITPSEAEDILSDVSHLPEGYEQWAVLLAAEALRRERYVDEAWNIIPEAGRYWATSWANWAHRNDDTRVEPTGTYPPV